MKILLCDGDYKNALGIIRSLGRNGHEVTVMAGRKGCLCSKSKYCHAEEPVPDYDAPEFEQTFFDIIERRQIELVIPVGTPAYRRMSNIKDRILEKSGIVIADSELISFCMDKEKTYRHAEKIGLPVPKTFYPESSDQVESIGDEISFPCVIKGRFETGFNIIAYAGDKIELMRNYLDLCRRYDLQKPHELPMIQKYITGDGYGFFAVYNGGRCGPTFQHHRLREYPPEGGMSVCSESSRHEQVFEFGKKLLDSLNWHGPAMVEFKTDAEGVPMLMEVNPKFWGSLDLGLEAGVDFPQALVDIVQTGQASPTDFYRYPFKYHWPLHGDLLHSLKRPHKLPIFIADCVNPGVKSNLWLRDDLRGTFGIITNLAEKLMRRIFGKK